MPNDTDTVDAESTPVTPVIPIRPPDKILPPLPRRPSIRFPYSHALAFGLGAIAMYYIMRKRDD